VAKHVFRVLSTIFRMLGKQTLLRLPKGSVGAVSPQLMFVCRWYALLLARSVNTQLALCEAWSGALDVTGRLLMRWPGDCSSSRLMALLLGTLLGMLLFTEARSMGRAVQWSPMKPESWSGWFWLKSSPTCSYCWLLWHLQNVPREHAICTAGTVRANRSEASSLLAGWTELRLLRNCLQADPSENTALPLDGPKWKHCSQQYMLRLLVAMEILFIRLLPGYRFA
jgi:hypothetical protein